jgi:hypothetical protein
VASSTRVYVEVSRAQIPSRTTGAVRDIVGNRFKVVGRLLGWIRVVRRSDVPMVGTMRVVFSVIVGSVELAFNPVDLELILSDTVTAPVKAHVDRFGSFLFDRVVGDSCGGTIVGDLPSQSSLTTYFCFRALRRCSTSSRTVRATARGGRVGGAVGGGGGSSSAGMSAGVVGWGGGRARGAWMVSASDWHPQRCASRGHPQKCGWRRLRLGGKASEDGSQLFQGSVMVGSQWEERVGWRGVTKRLKNVGNAGKDQVVGGGEGKNHFGGIPRECIGDALLAGVPYPHCVAAI